jgi:hypothetical protein
MVSFYPRNPFPLNQKIILSVLWVNRGKSPARQSIPLGKIYILDDVDAATQNAMIKEWRDSYPGQLKDVSVRESPLMFQGIARALYVEGPVLTEDLARALFVEKNKHLFIISAVTFVDGAGKHESHACQRLIAIEERGGLIWNSAIDYVTQIDLK